MGSRFDSVIFECASPQTKPYCVYAVKQRRASEAQTGQIGILQNTRADNSEVERGLTQVFTMFSCLISRFFVYSTTDQSPTSPSSGTDQEFPSVIYLQA